MSQLHYVRDNAGDVVEITGRIQFLGDNPGADGFVQNAEEGTIGSSSIRLDDEDGTFNVRGHRIFFSKETDAAADGFGGVFGVAYTGARDIVAGHPWNGVGRVWSIELNDINTVLERRKILGADANRPAETDVARIQWLFSIDEMLSAITDSTYLSTASPVTMSKADYRKQTPRDVLDDCAQQSAKNWYVMSITDAFTFSLWYGHGSLTTFQSAAVIDHVTGYAPSDGTKIKIDPTRIASGVIADGDSDWVYRRRPQTAVDFAIGGRDVMMSAPNIKTRTALVARANRYLRDLATEEYTVETAIIVAPADVNIVRHGHRVQARFPWAPDGLDALTWYRVLTRTVRPLAPGKYELSLTMVTDAPATTSALCTGLTSSQTFTELGGSGNTVNVSTLGNVVYLRPGIIYPEVVTPGHQGSWHFPEFGAGFDSAMAQAQNQLRVLVVGDGTLTVQMVTTDVAMDLVARLVHADSGVPGGYVIDSTKYQSTGTTFTFSVSTHDGVNCTHWVEVTGIGGERWGFTAAVWTAS